MIGSGAVRWSGRTQVAKTPGGHLRRQLINGWPGSPKAGIIMRRKISDETILMTKDARDNGK